MKDTEIINQHLKDFIKILHNHVNDFTLVEWHETYSIDLFKAGHNKPASSLELNPVTKNKELRWYLNDNHNPYDGYGCSELSYLIDKISFLKTKMKNLSDDENESVANILQKLNEFNI